MYKPTVCAVHRVTLEADRTGQITVGHLRGRERVCPDGATVVLDCGNGYWIRESELHHIRSAFSNVRHISITGSSTTDAWGGGWHFGTVYGLASIAQRLDQLLSSPPLFETA